MPYAIVTSCSYQPSDGAAIALMCIFVITARIVSIGQTLPAIMPVRSDVRVALQRQQSEEFLNESKLG